MSIAHAVEKIMCELHQAGIVWTPTSGKRQNNQTGETPKNFCTLTVNKMSKQKKKPWVKHA